MVGNWPDQLCILSRVFFCDRIFWFNWRYWYTFFVGVKRVIRERRGIVRLIMELFFRAVEKTFLSLTSRAPAHTNNTKTGAMRKKKTYLSPVHEDIYIYTETFFVRNQQKSRATFSKENERRVFVMFFIFHIPGYIICICLRFLHASRANSSGFSS